MADNTITWEEKVDMVRLHNCGECDQFKEFVRTNISRFDDQAMEMFLDCIEFGNADNHKFLYEIHDELQKWSDDFRAGMRGSIRLIMALNPDEYFKV